jgi:hypothetical protein
LNSYGTTTITDSRFIDNNCQTSRCVVIRGYSSYVTGNVSRTTFENNFGANIIEYEAVQGSNVYFMDNTLDNNQVQLIDVQAILKVRQYYS